MKKKVIFFVLSVLLCISTFAFAAGDRTAQIINILFEEKMERGQRTPWFSLTFYNLFPQYNSERKVPPGSSVYLENPREQLKAILKKLSLSQRQELFDKDVFTEVLTTIKRDTAEMSKGTYDDMVRKELVRAQIELRQDEGKEDFAEELAFFKKSAEFIKQSSKQENRDSKTKSERLMKNTLGSILVMAEESDYAEARRYVLKILRQEGTLGLLTSVEFIDKVEGSLSYKSAGEQLETKANSASTNLEEKKTFYSQAAEEYGHCGSRKQYEMLSKAGETQQKIETLRSHISLTQTEVDRIAGQGNYEDAVQKLNSALVAAKKIGESELLNILEIKRSNYSRAIDLAKQIKTAKDLKTLDTFSSQINIELTGHEKLKFLALI
jgi:hypothetical protein